MGFNLYDLWVSDVYVMGFGHILGKGVKFLYRLWVLTNFCCSCYGFQTFVVLKGFSLLYLLWVQLYLLWVQVICSTKKFKCIAYDCSPLGVDESFWAKQQSCITQKVNFSKWCLFFDSMHFWTGSAPSGGFLKKGGVVWFWFPTFFIHYGA